MLKDEQDAVGHELLGFHATESGLEIVERDNRFFDLTGGPKVYFAEYEEWPSREKRAMKYIKGRAMDIGCGAGRHGLYLQTKGFQVLGIDNSPLAICVCRERGLRDARVMPVTQLSSRLGTFDTLLMLGNNFGLFGTRRRAKWLLRRFWRMTSEDGRIIAESYSPRGITVPPEHQAYQERNRRRGKMPGHVRIRVHYRTYGTPWFDYLMVSEEEMEEILDHTGWGVVEFLESDTPAYIAVIDKRGT